MSDNSSKKVKDENDEEVEVVEEHTDRQPQEGGDDFSA